MPDTLGLVNRIYDHVESDEIDKAVYTSLRLSRMMGDTFSSVLFLRELSADKKQFDSECYDEVKHLKKEAQEFVWKTTHEHWLEGRDLGYSLTDNPDESILINGVGELVKEVVHLKDRINDFKIPDTMGEYDSAAFTDKYDSVKTSIRLKIKANSTVLERVRTRCLNYASRIEK